MKSAVIALVTLAACTSTAPPFVVANVTDLGVLPLPADAIGRDGGNAGMLDGQLLWTFGDTFLAAPTAIDGSTLLSATSGWSAPATPLALAQSLDGSGSDSEPAQLIPYTADEIAANMADFQNGVALWPGALIDTGDPDGLVSYQLIDRGGSNGFETTGVGTARVAAGATVATRTPGLLFASPDPLFQPQETLDGYVYALDCEQRGFLDFACKLARAPNASAEQRSAYEFFDGTAWTSTVANAVYAIDQAANVPTISYNAYLGRYLAVNCEIVSSTVLLRTAAQPEGPWDDGVEISAGSAGVLAPTDSSNYNYICVEHPELASDDGKTIVISYSRPTSEFHGDVRLAQITLQ